MQRSSRLLFTCMLMLAAGPAAAHFESQVHARGGALGATYDGTRSGTFLLPSAFDLEFELFLSTRRSIAFRSIFAMELPDSLPRYMYFGTGVRQYIGSQGMSFHQEDGQVRLQTVPTTRFYVGADVGVSVMILQSFGGILQIVSGLIDIGASAGVIQSITPQLGVNAQIGGSTVHGFTSASLLGFTYRGLIGLTYTF